MLLQDESLEECNKEKRIRNTENKINRQLKIAKHFNIVVTTPHRFHKQSATNCGNPRCIFCGNPRKIWKHKTIQEQRFLQDCGDPDNLTL